jgi:23S rRNA (cytosine1962-C5)-methyltransferase
MNTVILKPGRDKTARKYHPWIFSGAIKEIKGDIGPGEIIEVYDGGNNFIAYGYYNVRSQIRVRMLEWDKNVRPDYTWWFDKLRAAIERRKQLLESGQTNSCRLIYGESDLLPGLIVDKYSDYLVVQALSAGIEKVKNIIVSSLEKIVSPVGIFERSDTESRTLEGLPSAMGILWGKEPPNHVIIKENGFSFSVDIKSGQKSGFYLDQRDNRAAVSKFAAGLYILDCFSYSGGFSVYALGSGAKSATLVDSSKQSLELAFENIKLNRLEGPDVQTVAGDVFEVLRIFRDEGKTFDMIILDPPKFAPSKADLKKALLGYKDINLSAMRLLRPGGILATFSCSGAVNPQTLQTVLFWAATDANRSVQILQSLSQGIDHPRLVTFPESEYLKGFICRVI